MLICRDEPVQSHLPTPTTNRTVRARLGKENIELIRDVNTPSRRKRVAQFSSLAGFFSTDEDEEINLSNPIRKLTREKEDWYTIIILLFTY